jgi:RNA polymerase sigma factor (sigma-70 family)
MNPEDDTVVAVLRRERFQANAPMYLKVLLALVIRWTRNPELGQEIAQQTIFKYFIKREAENWQTDIKNEKAYLAKMARNLVSDGWRAYGKADVSLDQETGDGSPAANQLQCNLDLAKGIYLEELRQTIPLKTILGGFTEYQLRLLILREVEGLTYKEIGLEVNLNPAIVRYDLQKVKATIRFRVKAIFGKKSFFRSGT